MNEENYRVYSVNGPVVTVKGGRGLAMQDMVYVGKSRLIGEVVGIERDHATVQVYESTTGLAPGEPVEQTGAPLTLELGPGLLGGIFDGIARPRRSGHPQPGRKDQMGCAGAGKKRGAGAAGTDHRPVR